MHVELLIDVGDVGLGGTGVDTGSFGDEGARMALGEHGEDLVLTGRQAKLGGDGGEDAPLELAGCLSHATLEVVLLAHAQKAGQREARHDGETAECYGQQDFNETDRQRGHLGNNLDDAAGESARQDCDRDGHLVDERDVKLGETVLFLEL